MLKIDLSLYSIKEFLHILNNVLNSIECLLIISGLMISIIFTAKNKKDYRYKYELATCLKMSFFLVIVGYFAKTLEIVVLTKFNTRFYDSIALIFLIIFSLYLLDRYFFYEVNKEKDLLPEKECKRTWFEKKINVCINNIFCKSNSVLKLNKRYLNYLIVVTYIYLFIGSMNRVESIILSIIWQIIFISIKYSLENIENKESKKKDDKCILYKTRVQQLNVLKDTIKNSDYENYAIAITGEWGSGKSELISALIDECKNDKTYYISIKPMISDTQESLIREFQKSISKIMKNNGIYTGKNSSLDKYVKETLKLIQFNSKLALSDFVDLMNEDKSYKELKKDLQKDINLILNKNTRLIVIIDDFDRVEEEKQLEILSFIKEVIDFDGCVTIIALDYKNLKDNNVVKQKYLEKFIATQIPLVCVEFHEIVKNHIEDILKKDKLKNNFSKNILEEISKNICNYYDIIQMRVDSQTKSNDMDKFYRFSVSKKMYTHSNYSAIK